MGEIPGFVGLKMSYFLLCFLYSVWWIIVKGGRHI